MEQIKGGRTQAVNEDKLAPCPFCGEAPECSDKKGFISCMDHKCPGYQVVTLKEAWNRRAVPAPPEMDLEEAARVRDIQWGQAILTALDTKEAEKVFRTFNERTGQGYRTDRREK